MLALTIFPFTIHGSVLAIFNTSTYLISFNWQGNIPNLKKK